MKDMKPFEEFLTPKSDAGFGGPVGVHGCVGTSGVIGKSKEEELKYTYDPNTGKLLDTVNSIIIKVPGQKDINLVDKINEFEETIEYLEGVCDGTFHIKTRINYLEGLIEELEGTVKKQNKKIKKLKKRKR